MTRQDLFAHIADTYGITPDYPFEEDFVTAVFRHTGNRKWFAIAMRIPRGKLGLRGEGHVDVVNLKVSPEMIPSLTQEPGIFPAYHMSKTHWVTVALDGGESVADCAMTAFLVEVSFTLTHKKRKT
jgi:predicted DNA-binding protein (MmcQ/YjbR family)